ncbi:MAG: hypothetical protein ACRDLP_01265 [Solirubrobacteraceae bacterium]
MGALVAAVLALATAPAAFGAGTIDGISDQNVPYWNGLFWHGGAPVSPFGQFLAARAAGTAPGAQLHYARYVVAYDVMCDPSGPAFATFQAWLADVQQLGLQPVVGFWYGDFDGNRCPTLPKIPTTVAQYNGATAVAGFLAQFPSVRIVEPWNEPNDGSGPDVPAARAAAFWLAAHADCQPAGCPTVLGGDFSDAQTNLGSYEQKYVAALGGVDPIDWAIHPYHSTNYQTTAPLTTFDSELPSPTADRVWYTEVGAFYCTPKDNLKTGFTDTTLQQMQDARARYLVGTLMAPPFAPVHVFYYEFMYKNNIPGPCATDDSALFAPTSTAPPLSFGPRLAAQEILPAALAPPPVPSKAPPPPSNAIPFSGEPSWTVWADARTVPAG